MPKFNVFPDEAKVTKVASGATIEVHDNESLDLERLAPLGDWQTEEEYGATLGHVKLEQRIVYVDGSGTRVAVPAGAYLLYGHEGFYVWSDEFFQKAMKEADNA